MTMKLTTITLATLLLSACSSRQESLRIHSPSDHPDKSHIVTHQGKVIGADPSGYVRHQMRVDPTGSD